MVEHYRVPTGSFAAPFPRNPPARCARILPPPTTTAPTRCGRMLLLPKTVSVVPCRIVRRQMVDRRPTPRPPEHP